MFFLAGVMKDIFIRGYFISLPFIFVGICILLFKKKYVESLLLFFFSALALYQIRHLPFAILAAIAIIPTAIAELTVRVNESTRLLLSCLFVFFLFAGMSFFGSNLFFETFDINKSFGFGYEIKDTNVFSFLKEHSIRGAIFNNFDIGSFLSYGLYPEVNVFVDGRPEAYPASFFQDVYIPLEEDQKVQDIVFKQYNIHTVVVSHTDQTPWGSAFLSRILQDKRWKLLFVDPVFVVLSDEENAKDIRSTDAFLKQIEDENNFFHLAQYENLLSKMGEQAESTYLIEKINTIRPYSCSLIRMRSTQFDAPWCSF